MSDARRNSELAKIHLACAQLAISDETRMLMVARITRGRATSSAHMTAPERGILLDELRKKGFHPAPARAAKAQRQDKSETARKIRACWLDLKDAGALRDASEAALRKFAERMTGKRVLDWLTPAEANQVIEALKSWHRRALSRASTAS